MTISNSTKDRSMDPHQVSQTERRERIAMLLRHSEGASIEQLTYLTKSDATDVRSSIHEIIDAGFDVEVRTKFGDNSKAFLLFD